MVIDPFSMILLPAMINIFTGPINAISLLKRFQNRQKPINHDLQKAIKIAYLQALIEIATECQAGKIKSFRIYLPTEIDKRIKQWQTELKQVENAKEETEISSPLQDTAEIEQLLLSHGKPIGEQIQELETRLISQALQGISDLPVDYHNQIQTGLFSRIYAHFVEQLKINDRAYRAFELEYLPTINASLTEIGVGQEQVALTMENMFSVVNRTDQNVQKIIDILNPKSLTVEDWQEICRQNLAQQKQLTTNPFTNANGVTPQLDEIYVPLAIVERKPPKPPSRNQQEEKEEEKLIPIAEECFFEEVLRQGKSEISQGRKIAIIGEPGSGKTTRLQKIADWILEQDLGLPIWISLADLTQPTITQYIEEIWLKQTGKSLTIEELTQQKHRIWLLLDGLDEMTSRVETRHVSALLGGWVQAARVVVTCRVNVWEADKNAFSGFDVFRNLEFNPEQVTDYIRRWFAGMGDAATGESLEAALAQSENSRLKELIQNPLRLWMLCQIWQLRAGVLPDTKAKLYEQFVKYVYRWNKHEKTIKEYVKLCGMNQRECKENLHKALGDLAKAALTQKYSFFRLSYGLVDEYLGDENEETSLLSLALSLGWLNRSGLDVDEPEKSAYAFYHTTFQEYFAALAVDDWDYFLPRNHVNFPVAGKEYRIFEPQWKQVILLWLGRGDVADEEKEGFIEKLVNFDDGCGEWNFEKVDRGFYEYRAYFLAAAGIGESKSCSIADVIVQRVVKCGFGDFNEEKQEWITYFAPIKKEATEVLPETIRDQAIRWLTGVLEICTDRSEQLEAAYTLGKISRGNEQAIVALTKILATSIDKATQILETENTQHTLIRSLKFSINKANQYLSAYSLGEINKVNEQMIIELIMDTNLFYNFRLKSFKNRLFDSIKEDIISEAKPTIPELIRLLLKTSTEQSTQSIAAYSLEKISLVNESVIRELIIILKNSTNESAQMLAAEILGTVGKGNQTAIPELIKILENSTNQWTQWLAADSLLAIDPNNEQVISRLIRSITTFPNQNENITNLILYRLKKILATPEFISILNHCTSNEAYENNFKIFESCYELLWNIAQHLAYPDFYRAWHGLTETQTSPLVQTLNLAQLPQLLQTQLTETNLHQILQLLCIDSSKFDNRDNPATDIYLQLVKKHHCPKSTEGTPRTLTELKIYWQLLDWEKHPILIFYEETNPQGFSQTFLDSLTRFDATICAIADSPHPTIPTFSPQDPHLIQSIMNWLQRTILEA
jgi:energy-coupling factor transporter ATP-binding protein EcfA2